MEFKKKTDFFEIKDFLWRTEHGVIKKLKPLKKTQRFLMAHRVIKKKKKNCKK